MLDVQKEREREQGKYHLVRSDDGTQLFLREWSPKGKSHDSEYCILIFHGITAHSKPYEFLAKPLAEAGIPVYGLDLRGHGLSDGKRGDMPSRETLVTDLKHTVEFIQQEFKKKVIILGHSLGVLTSMIFLHELPDYASGVILLSFARNVKEGAYQKPSLGFKLKFLLYSVFAPSKQIVHYYREGMLGLDDPLFTFWYSPRFFKTYKQGTISFPKELHIPIFYGIGEEDELFSVESAEEFFQEIPTSDKELFVFAKSRHAVFTNEVVQNILEWLQRKFMITTEPKNHH